MRDDNPARGLPGPDRGSRKGKQWLYPSEFARLLACEEVPRRWRELYALHAYLYLRSGELAALEWSAVQLDHGYVSVHQSLELETGRLKATKTGRGRKVPIPDTLKLLLLAMRSRDGGWGRVLRHHDDRRKSNHGLPPADSLAATLREHLRRAGIDRRDLFEATPATKPMTLYDLRACGITWSALAGVEPMKLMQRAGHSSFSTTLLYVREAEAVGLDVGEPFGPLPATLLSASAAIESHRKRNERNERRQACVFVRVCWRPQGDTASGDPGKDLRDFKWLANSALRPIGLRVVA